MTDEERKEAERLAADYGLGHRHLKTSQHFIDGYAAACEAKREQYGRDISSSAFDETVAELQSERARSAELLETIKEVIRNSHDIVAKKLCSRTLAEFEAGRD